MKMNKLFKKSILVFFGLIFSATIWAHGGAKGTDTDQCKIEIDGEWVHYTAYQPFKAPGKEYCAAIPEINTPTNLVFDYIGTKLRNMKMEYEITKEPEGTRVLYKEPEAHSSGTINATHTFTAAGRYLIHMKLIPETGDDIDVHLGFSIGGGAATSMMTYALYAFFLFAALYVLYLSHAGFKEFVNGLIKKATD